LEGFLSPAYDAGMDERDSIARVRRDEGLRRLLDGSEAVPITLQYKGILPPLPREDRRDWLRERFREMYGEDVQLDLGSVSASGQTVEALCSVEHLDELSRKIASNNDRIDVVRTRHAEL
jgi:hypothetical protein